MTAEVSQISQHGVWLLLDNREMFLPYDKFPWFKNAPVSAIQNVKLLNRHHLYWSDLDIDLEVESIEHRSYFRW